MIVVEGWVSGNPTGFGVIQSRPSHLFYCIRYIAGTRCSGFAFFFFFFFFSFNNLSIMCQY